MHDLHNRFTVRQALEAIVVNNDSEGTGLTIDLQGYEGCEFIVDVGASGDTLSGSVYADFKLQEGNASNMSDAAAVAYADMLGPIAASNANGIFATVDDPAEDSTVLRVGYIGNKRYVRLFIDVTGTHTNGTPIAAVVLLSHGRHMPPAKPAV